MIAMDAPFDGWAASCGVDPEQLPLARLCNMAYWFVCRNADDKQRRQLDRELVKPIIGMPSTYPTADEEMALVDAALGMRGGGKG